MRSERCPHWASAIPSTPKCSGRSPPPPPAWARDDPLRWRSPSDSRSRPAAESSPGSRSSSPVPEACDRSRCSSAWESECGTSALRSESQRTRRRSCWPSPPEQTAVGPAGPAGCWPSPQSRREKACPDATVPAPVQTDCSPPTACPPSRFGPRPDRRRPGPPHRLRWHPRRTREPSSGRSARSARCPRSASAIPSTPKCSGRSPPQR